MSIRKVSVHEFQQQIKGIKRKYKLYYYALDVRSQINDQIKCLENRTDTQISILHEVNDFLKKRAEIDLEYSKQLDKLVKSVMLKYKNEKQKFVFFVKNYAHKNIVVDEPIGLYIQHVIYGNNLLMILKKKLNKEALWQKFMEII